MLKNIAVTFLKIRLTKHEWSCWWPRYSREMCVLVIEGEAFKAILLDRLEVAVSVLRHMSNRVRQLNEHAGMPLAAG